MKTNGSAMESGGLSAGALRGLAVAFVATLAALVLCTAEALLEYRVEQSPLDQRRALAVKLGITFDRRSQFDVLRDLRATGVRAMPMLGAQWFSREHAALVEGVPPLTPLTGVARAPTVTCNEDGHWGRFESDRHGFNNPDSAWATPPEIVLIGDSFSQGQCVDDGQDIGAGLRRLGHSTLALGNGGNGPLLDHAVFLEYGLPARPRFVIWEFFDNDVDDLRVELEMPVVKAYLPPGKTQQLMAREAERDSLVRDVFERALAHPERLPVRPPLLQRVRRFVTLGALRDLAGQKWRSTRPQVAAEPAATIREIVAAARDSLAAHDGTLVVAYFPSWEHFKFDLRLSRELRDSLAAISRGLGVPFLDVEGPLRVGGDLWKAFALGDAINTHYSAEGYRRVAAGIDAFLRERAATSPALSAPPAER